MTHDDDLKLDIQQVLTRAGEQALEQMMQADPRRRSQATSVTAMSDAQSAQLDVVEQVMVKGLENLRVDPYIVSDLGRTFGRPNPKRTERWWVVPVSGMHSMLRGQVGFSMAVARLDQDQLVECWAYNPISRTHMHVDRENRVSLNGFSCRMSGLLQLDGAYFHMGYPTQKDPDFFHAAQELARWGVQCFRSDDLIGDAIKMAGGAIDGIVDYQATYAQSAITLHMLNAAGCVCSQPEPDQPLADPVHSIAIQPQIADEVVSRLSLPAQII